MRAGRLRPVQALREFLQLESAGGILLIGAAALAILLANSPLAGAYQSLLALPFEVRLGTLEVAKPLLLWINDGLMAIFFLLVGLEVKREILEGQLSNLSQVALPGLAAIGGMVVPALIYVSLNWGDTEALNGWAIPAATDIAFALGILSLRGKGVPTSLKVLLLTIAIIDDLAAITIIAIFYSGDLSLISLILAAVTLVVLALLNWQGVTRIAAYTLLGFVLWFLVLKSGVHATLAGVALAFAIPLRVNGETHHSPLHQLEHSLHPWVAYGVLPLFAFANAGVPLANMQLGSLLSPIPLGIAAGLFLGKQIGVFGLSWLGIQLGLARKPEGVGWLGLYSVAILCGIGFTMSLFINSLAFEHGATSFTEAARLSILIGSLLSAVFGYLVLSLALKRESP
ncbi:MAG TPA: Na+/H+ antiporter NhaA [Anaerolineales bacterium]